MNVNEMVGTMKERPFTRATAHSRRPVVHAGGSQGNTRGIKSLIRFDSI